MRHSIAFFASALLLLSSCGEGVIDVTDWSFKIGASVEPDESSSTYALCLILSEGDRDEDYTMEYGIDGMALLSLYDSGGKAVPGRSELDFSAGGAVVYSLPELDEGDHTVDLSISTEHHTEELSVPFTVSVKPLGFSAEAVVPKSGESEVRVSLLSGRKDVLYSVSVTEGGTQIASAADISFEKSAVAVIPLTGIRPGAHNLEVTLSDGSRSLSEPLSFTETVRHPQMVGTIRYDGEGHRVLFSVSSNPYGLRIKAETDFSLKGEATVNLDAGDPYTGPYRMTRQCTLSDRTAIGPLVPNVVVGIELCDFSSLESRMTEKTERSWNWSQQWQDMGEGSTEFVWGCLGTTTDVPYAVAGREAAVQITCEKLEGVSLVLYSGTVDWITTEDVIYE